MLCVEWVIGHLFLFLLSKISISTLKNFYFYPQKIWFFYFSFYCQNFEIRIQNFSSYFRDQNLQLLFLPSKEIRISNFSFFSRFKIKFQISLSTLEVWDQNYKFLFLLLNLLFWLSSMPGLYICFSLRHLFCKNEKLCPPPLRAQHGPKATTKLDNSHKCLAQKKG